MLIEAIRARLVESGISEAANWSREQIMEHMDNTLLQYSTDAPEQFPGAVREIMHNIGETVVAIGEVLQEPH